jgi:tetratricopeptide (TPR) repeat protein
MKLRGKARQRERARRRAAEQRQGCPMGLSQDRRQAMLRKRGGDLAAIVGREDECIEVLTQALELDPDDFRSRLGLSFVLMRLGEYERAWPHYSEVMIEDGRDAPAWGESRSEVAA